MLASQGTSGLPEEGTRPILEAFVSVFLVEMCVFFVAPTSVQDPELRLAPVQDPRLKLALL